MYKKQVLGEKVHYYEDGIKDIEKLMSTLDDIIDIEKQYNIEPWLDWTASNDKNFIYGETKTFDLNSIDNFPTSIITDTDKHKEYKEKMKYIYDVIMQSFYDVSKDYAVALGDNDEPKLFPVFNIKKYSTGSAMGAHFDQLDGDKTLRYSLVMYLNDDFEGGEISFVISDYDGVKITTSSNLDYDLAVKAKDFDFGIKPKAGSVIIFPSSAPYFHTAHIVKSGFKYMVPGHWIHNNMDFHKSSM